MIDINVDVTQADIDNGTQSDANNCAISLAIMRLCRAGNGNITKVDANERGISIYTDNDEESPIFADPSEEVFKFINDYDADKSQCKPFSFTI